MKFAVVGAGATGGAVGVFPCLAGHEVWFVDPNEAHMNAIAEHGLNIELADYSVQSEDEIKKYVVRVNATTDPHDVGKADVVILMPKTPQTRAAMKSVSIIADEHTVVLTLQNGIGSTEIIAETIAPNRIAYGFTTLQGGIPKPGYLIARYPKDHHIIFGSDAPELRPILEEVAEIFRSAGCDTHYAEDIKARVWEKVALNCGGNAGMAILRLNNKQAFSFQEWVDINRTLLDEVRQVAKAEGVELNPDVIYAYCKNGPYPIDNSPLPITYPSMAQDAMNHRKTEIDSLNGAVIRIAARHGIRVPYNEVMYKMMSIIENAYDMQF